MDPEERECVSRCHPAAGRTDSAVSVSLALAYLSRNSIGNLTPRRKTRFRKFPWKSDPFRETIQTLPPRLNPRDPSETKMPLRASENLRFQVQKSQNH